MKKQIWTVFYKFNMEIYGNKIDQGWSLKKNSHSSKTPTFDMKTMYKKENVHKT